ncbi:hypothetical protein L208DRAFT_1405882 [Tricholoma matsutake]|nr:hypothetical protein L208DRAFT_1405882 [Tricholoma matsutake 945]
MLSRNAYAALTPDFADFSILPSARGPQSPTLRTGTSEDDELTEDHGRYRWHAALSTVRAAINDHAGFLLVTASQAFFSLMNFSVKVLNTIDPPVSALQIIVVRMTWTWVLCVAYMFWVKMPDPFLGPKGVRWLLLLRGFSGFFGLFGIYFSLQYLSLSDAVVLTFLAPFCTGLAGSIFLGESFTRKEAFASLFSLFGVVLIARPAFLFGTVPTGGHTDRLEAGTPAQRLMAVGVAVIGVLGSTGAYISIRAIGTRANPLHAMISFSTLSVIFASVAFIATKEPLVIPTRWDWIALLVLIGIFGFIAQVLLTMGMRCETVSRSTMALYSQVVFAMLLERIFFKSYPSALSLVGTLTILTSALYVALTKKNKSEPKSDIIRMDEVSDTSLEEGLLEQMRREDDIKNELSEHSLYIKTPIEDPHSRATEGYAGDVDTSV